MNEIFSSLKVIELAGVLAGPSVGMFFAELGAEVIKIENPNQKDVTRTWKLPSEDTKHPVSAYFSSINYKKRYLSLDLTQKDDYKQLVDLLSEADILLTNFKKESAKKIHLTDDFIFHINPRIIHGKISGFGEESDRVAFDLIVQAESGFMALNGEENGMPTKMPVALIDVLTAHQLKEGILCALFEREKTGKGKIVETSLYASAVSSLVNQASGYLMEKHLPKRMGSKHPCIAPYGEIFLTKDEQQITLAIGSNRQFQQLLIFLQLYDLQQDERFISNQQRVIHRNELFALLQNSISDIKSNLIMDWSEQHFIPCGIIKNLDQVFKTPVARQLVREETIDEKATKRVSSIAFTLKNQE